VNFRRARYFLIGLLCLQAGLLVAALAGAPQALVSPAHAQGAAQRTVPAPSSDAYAAASRWTLGLMTSGVDSTSLQMAADLGRVVNDGPNLRIVPMAGESSIQNVMDLLYLKGVDLAVVQSDVLAQLKRTKRLPGLEERLQYITKLHSEEFHVLARMKYLCLADLSGRKVNFGLEGSGTALTAEAVFGARQVKVQPQYMDHATAIEKLKSGEIDATVIVSGKPSAAFTKVRYTDRVHFLDVEFDETLQKDYLPAIMTHDDYPDLIATNETVGTIAVSAVLAVANVKAGTEQHRKVSRFVESFFDNLEKLRQPTRHAKWQEVSPALPLTGWVRFSTAQEWLSNNPQASAPGGPQPAAVFTAPPSAAVAGNDADRARALFQNYLRNRDTSGQSRQELFNEFVRWYQQNNPN
jgi:TRAP transporter TAXI family solute receptor